MSQASNVELFTVTNIYKQPLLELLFQAQTTHRQYFSNQEIEGCALLSIKTGACPEDCGYCSQSGHHQTGLEKEKLLDIDEVLSQAQIAKERGAKRFCMGAAWRSPPAKAMPQLVKMIESVKALGLETCMTLGMLDECQAQSLKDAGLDYYNHNLDTSPNFYDKVTTTRTQKDRLDTLYHVAKAGLHVCCGGILGLGESEQDRIELLHLLANLPTPPKSVPINQLVKIPGTPMYNAKPVDWSEFVRTIATARILLPEAMIRLSAGRSEMSETYQTLCFMAGANSIWLGDKLLTTPNCEITQDDQLFAKLGMRVSVPQKNNLSELDHACSTY